MHNDGIKEFEKKVFVASYFQPADCYFMYNHV